MYSLVKFLHFEYKAKAFTPTCALILLKSRLEQSNWLLLGELGHGLANKMTTSISPLHLFSAIVSLIVLPLTRPKRALQPSRFHIRLKCAIQQEELLTLRVRRRAKHAINSDSGAPFSSLRRSTRCTRRS